MLKLFTHTNVLVEKHRSEVFPLLFDLVFKKNKTLLAKYKIVENINIADIVVCPIDYATYFRSYRCALNNLIILAKTHNKPFWIYTSGDYGFTTYLPNVVTFRLGGFHSKLDNKTFILPSFINDPYKSVIKAEFSVLQKTEKPTIGFVGHAKSGVLKYLKEYHNHLKYQIKRRFGQLLADKQKFYPSSVKRAGYLQKLQLSKNLDTNFIFRDKYRAGEALLGYRKKSSEEFFNNIFKNGYTFCIRGVGNFSVRFYETLAMGRIPIVIDTDCRFPLDDKINWKNHCLIIKEKTNTPLAISILEFHNSLSASEFEALQHANRNLWLSILQREAYFLEIYQQFKVKLQQ